MTREQVLEISKAVLGLPRYKNNIKLRAVNARRIFKLRKEIAENGANVQTNPTRSVS